MTGFPGTDVTDRELLGAATEAARAAAEVHRSRHPDAGGREWTEKGPSDFVTEVDREAERRVVDLLRDRFPDHAVLAEETADASPGGPEPAGEAGSVRWIVDPLDGTTNWLHGYPEHAVSIAAADADGLRVAVVLNSADGELFRAVRGAGSRRDGERIRVSPVRELRLALVGTGFPFKKQEISRVYLDSLGRVLAATSGVRRTGSAALDLCALACGRLDAFFELWLMPWDVAGGALVVQEAGGSFRPLDVPWVPAGAPLEDGLVDLRAGGYLGAAPGVREAFEKLVEEAGRRR
ncbi:MAG: inositol monophosphatase family protein [Gemmatimonadota bacterium]